VNDRTAALEHAPSGGHRPADWAVIIFPTLQRVGLIPLSMGQMAIGVGRRQFISALGGASLAWPLTARAQQPTLPVVGFLNQASAKANASFADAFRRGLSDAGFVHGNNVTIEYRWAEGQYDRLPQLAAELVQRKVSIIAAAYTLATQAALAATPAIPVVFVIGIDPVRSGFVSSFNRPGGRATGLAIFESLLGAKRLGLAHDLVPTARSVALLVNPRNPPVTEPYVIDVQNAASSLGLELVVLRAGSEREIDDSFAKVAEQHIGVLMVATDAFFLSRIGYVVALALRHAVPTVYSDVEAVMAGGLMSYDTDLSAAYRQQGGYVARILKGEKPGELAVVQPTKFNSSSTWEPQKRWALPFQRVCSRSPTR
jgi:putative tryptophan/tyrosine transport system substrate-binding protein